MRSPSYDEETICAISTPLGQSGIGVIRISGKKSIEIGDRLFHSSSKKNLQSAASHTLHYGKLIDPVTGEFLDDVIASVMRSPKSYTCEDVLELSCHGNQVSLMKIISLLVREGAREALPGEFTKRAFLNGRIDLIQAEAVMDFISAETEKERSLALQHLNGDLSRVVLTIRDEMICLLSKLEANIDFVEQDIEILSEEKVDKTIHQLLERIHLLLRSARDGRVIREGFVVVLAGRPNVGKSTLFNTLLGRERAIVTPIAGTTRDILEESLLIRGIKVKLVDTAGIQATKDEVEKEGIKRAEEIIHQSDLVLWIVDATAGLTPDDAKMVERFSPKTYFILFNKIDLISDKEPFQSNSLPGDRVLQVSSLWKTGIAELQERISRECQKLTYPSITKEGSIIIRGRHERVLKKAEKALFHALESVRKQMSYEFIALDLKEAIDDLGEMVGITTPDEVLNQIFKDFCIGK